MLLFVSLNLEPCALNRILWPHKVIALVAVTTIKMKSPQGIPAAIDGEGFHLLHPRKVFFQHS